MKKVSLVAPVLTQSGYGVHARQIAHWLLRRSDIETNIYPVNWGDTPWLLMPTGSDDLLDKIMKNTVHPQQLSGADVSVQLQLPNEWNPTLAKVNIGITAGVETDICSKEWVECCNRMSLVIVPSNHVKETFERSGNLTTRVVVVPEAFTNAVTQPHDEGLFSFEKENNFLIVAQLTGTTVHTDRKNTFLTIKWLSEAFSDRNDVGIVIKTNAGRNTAIDRKLTTNIMKQLASEVRRGKGGPPIHLIHGNLSDSEMVSLYKNSKVKALVSLTRGEGFGLPILEAAACALPVIATNWSGHTDFLKHGNFISIDQNLVPVHGSKIDGKIFIQGSRWADPSEESFKKKVRKFIDSQSTPKQWAKDLSTKILQNYSLDSVCNMLDAETRDYL